MSLTRREVLVALAAAGAGLATGCTGDDPDSAPATEPTTAPPASPSTAPASPAPAAPGDPTRLSVDGAIAEDLTVPWGLAFLRDGSALVTERDTARVVRVGGGRTTTVGEVPGVDTDSGEGGLMGIVVLPGEDAVIAAFTSPDDNRIVRMAYDGRRLGRPKVLLDGIPRAFNHNGGRLVIGPDGTLYASTGDAGQGERSQDVDSPAGKVLRMTLDGKAAEGNPFGNRVWSYGHRNIEGLAFDSAGRLWAAEFGDQETDELNLIERGANYGWPQTEGPTDAKGITGPKAWWSTDDASPAGVGIAYGTAYVAALRGQCVWAVPLSGTDAGRPRRRLAGEDLGRIRNAVPAPDGSLWVTTSNTDGRGDPRAGDDRILRVTVG
ncbi:PQQ-dependent sugar dehydrogenase [Mumia sp. ZJ1417]|uniref:PQQ-dependent sugar dehydrogenase n=1 Tax=Mumia sp. ZJ1417 TaxID=2708082 RepID=UPI0014237B5C|nr:PQQ-dependent sugar dehydrogenase [Mumia sp. ZJ1417]QMW67572.1 PQQ-dependent sugar dehydrogenase [Mumia sp. ZJ1417]